MPNELLYNNEGGAEVQNPAPTPTTCPNYEVPADVDQQLQRTATKYRRELISMPIHGLEKSLPYMTLRPGIRVSETLAEISANAEFGPYDELREGDPNVKISPRTLEVFLGSVILPFSPNSVYSTIWGADQTQGDALKNVPITKKVLDLIALKLGQNLNKVLFNAVRNEQGTRSVDLFNGFDTIAASEITAGKISADLGNYVDLTAAIGNQKDADDNPVINVNNVLDVTACLCQSMDEELKDQDTFLYVPRRFKELYEEAYVSHYGSVPYNTKYHKDAITGYENVRFATLSNKKNAKLFEITTKSNMLIGVNQTQDSREKVEIERHLLKLYYVATKFFGVQFESINKERILFAGIGNTAATALKCV